MARVFFSWRKLLIIFVAIAIVIVGAVWFVSNNSPSPSTFPTPTPTIPSSSPTQATTGTPKPSPTTSNSITPIPSASSSATPNTSIINTPTVNPTVTQTITPIPSPTPPPPITVVFNFDNATPTLNPGKSTPFDQTSNEITAHFSSPTDFPTKPSFSVQNINSLAALSTVINSAKFSGLFLWPSTINRDRLDINFSRSITSISFVFKTAELHDPGPGGTGSPIRLTAYMNSASSAPVGSPTTVNGVETPFDNYPEGTLTFNASGQPFKLVEIDLPPVSSQGASGFIVDNITIVTA